MALPRRATITFLLLLGLPPGRPGAEPLPLDASGDFSFRTQYSSGSPPPQASPWDFTTHSRLALRYGGALLTVTASRPMGLRPAGLPDRHFTLDLSARGYGVRHGDIDPSFTPGTTGFMRIFGTEVEASLARVFEVDVFRGLTRAAAAPAGYVPGAFRQHVTGQRLRFFPAKPLTLGISAVKIKDDLGSVDLSGSPYRPRAQDNLLVGTDIHWAFLRRRAQLSVEYAASVHNRDLTAAATTGEVAADGSVSGWLAALPLFRRWLAANDSTAAGDLIGGRLVLPLATSRWTLEYRRASPSFRSLATPYEQANSERVRLNNYASLWSNTITAMAQAEYFRSNVSGTDLHGARAVSILPTVIVNFRRPGRLTVGWREDDRWNDAPPPSAGAPDYRLRRVMRSLNVSVSRDTLWARLPLSLTGTVLGSVMSDRVHPGADMATRSLLVSARTFSTSRVIWSSQLGYSRSRNLSSGVRRGEFQAQVKQGYEFFPERFRLFVSEGVSTTGSSDGRYAGTSLAWGAGGRWTPATGREIGLEWQSTAFRDLVSEESAQRQRVLDLYVTYGF